MSVVVHSVLGMSSARSGDLLPSRPAKEAVTEVIGMSVLGLFIVFVLGAFPSGNDGVYRAMGLAPGAGAVVLEHIGWAFGAYIPILLGFYAIVIGGQLVADPPTAARTRRTLGFTAEAMTGALVPALVLILAACIADPSQAGALFVIVPVSAVMFFLAVQLGGFIVFERELRLASAERSRDWAKGRLDTLRRRSRKPIWLVVAVHTLLGGLVGTGMTLILTRPTGSILVLVLLYGLIALGLAFASVHGVHASRTARDRTSKVMAWMIPSGLYLVGLLLAVEVLITSGASAGASVLAVVVFSALSTIWPRRWASRLLLNWTLQGAATGYAAKSVSSTYLRNMREIRELTETPDTEEPPTLRERVASALRAFREPLPHARPSGASGVHDPDPKSRKD